MKLVFFSESFPTSRFPHRGAFNAQMVTGLREAGDEVTVVTPVSGWSTLRGATESVDSGQAIARWWHLPGLLPGQLHRMMAAGCRRILDESIARVRPDVVLAYWTHPDGTVAAAAARGAGIPFVQIVGGSDALIVARDPRRGPIIARTLRDADGVFAVGTALRPALLAFGVREERLRVLERGVDRARFTPGDRATARAALGLTGTDGPVFLFLGRLETVKGIDLLLAAWPTVMTTCPTARLVVVGDGAARNDPRLHGPGVRWVGARPHAELPTYLQAASWLVLPSRSEGTPNVVLEALACGTPVVGAAVGEVPALLAPPSIVVAPDSIPALAAALRQAADEPQLRDDPSVIPDRHEAIARFRAHLRDLLPVTSNA